MYQPADGRSEFLELCNPSDSAVALHPDSDPLRTWQFTAGIRFAMPPATVMAPGSCLVVAGTAPGEFRREYDVPVDTPVVGPFEGRLDNAGERVELARPADADESYLPVDWLRYDDGAYWPVPAAGGGPSLERLPPTRYGNEPRHWFALSEGGTPGRVGEEPIHIYLPGIVDH
jgi:hypothetical protein